MKSLKITMDMINRFNWDCREFVGASYNLSGNTMFQKFSLDTTDVEVEVELTIYSKVNDSDELWEEINSNANVIDAVINSTYGEPRWEVTTDNEDYIAVLDEEAKAYMDSETTKFAQDTQDFLIEHTEYDIEQKA